MSRKLQGNLMLLLTALIWGTAFVAQKSGLDYAEPFTFNGIRTLVGAVALTPVVFFLRRSQKREAQAAEERKLLRLGGLCCGLVLFAAGSLQQIALQYTQVGKAGFITALYIVLVPVFGVFLRKRVRPLVWGCVAVSAVGLFCFACRRERASV